MAQSGDRQKFTFPQETFQRANMKVTLSFLILFALAAACRGQIFGGGSWGGMAGGWMGGGRWQGRARQYAYPHVDLAVKFIIGDHASPNNALLDYAIRNRGPPRTFTQMLQYIPMLQELNRQTPVPPTVNATTAAITPGRQPTDDEVLQRGIEYFQIRREVVGDVVMDVANPTNISIGGGTAQSAAAVVSGGQIASAPGNTVGSSAAHMNSASVSAAVGTAANNNGLMPVANANVNVAPALNSQANTIGLNELLLGVQGNAMATGTGSGSLARSGPANHLSLTDLFAFGMV